MTLTVDIERRLGAFRLKAAFEAGDGITALFGRSGAGKTSVVNAIAGILRPERGRITTGGEPVFDSGRGIDVPTPAVEYRLAPDRDAPELRPQDAGDGIDD